MHILASTRGVSAAVQNASHKIQEQAKRSGASPLARRRSDGAVQYDFWGGLSAGSSAESNFAIAMVVCDRHLDSSSGVTSARRALHNSRTAQLHPLERCGLWPVGHEAFSITKDSW